MKITYPECQIEISAKELIALMKYEEDRKPRITVDTDFISSIGRNLTTENAHTKNPVQTGKKPAERDGTKPKRKGKKHGRVHTKHKPIRLTDIHFNVGCVDHH